MVVDFDVNIIALELHFMDDGGWHRDRLSSADVELGPMSGAGGSFAFKVTFPKRSAVAGADIVQAAYRATDAQQHHKAVVDLD